MGGKESGWRHSGLRPPCTALESVRRQQPVHARQRLRGWALAWRGLSLGRAAPSRAARRPSRPGGPRRRRSRAGLSLRGRGAAGGVKAARARVTPLPCTRSSRYMVCRLTRMPSSVPGGSRAGGVNQGGVGGVGGGSLEHRELRQERRGAVARPSPLKLPSRPEPPGAPCCTAGLPPEEAQEPSSAATEAPGRLAAWPPGLCGSRGPCRLVLRCGTLR